MLKTIIKHIVLYVLPIIGTAHAQNNCDDLLRKAKDSHNKGNYSDAFAKYRAVKLCNPALSSEMDKLTEKLFADVDAQRSRAEQAEKKAKEEKDAANVARKKAEEAEALAKHEQQLAQKAETAAQEAKEKTERILESLYFYEDKFGVAVQYEAASKRQLYGFIDRNGDEVIGFKYRDATAFDMHGFAKVVLPDQELRVIDTVGNEYIFATSLATLSTNTQLLDLSNTPLDNLILSEDIVQANNLKVLILDNCDLQTLPNSLAKLSNLEYISLVGNSFSSLPSVIFQLSNLRGLRATDCAIQHLSSDISFLQKLEFLDLSYNKLKGLPNSINLLAKLRSVKINNNELQALPDSFLQAATTLKQLGLSGNELTALPSNFLNYFPQIEYLALATNNLNLAPQIPRLAKLRELDLAYNRFQDLFIDFDSLPALIKLNISSSSDIKYALKNIDIKNKNNLEFLICQNIHAKRLPEVIGDLPNLKILDLYETKLIKLPTMIAAGKTLKVLNIDYNSSLTSLEEIKNCTALRDLHADGIPQIIQKLPLYWQSFSNLEKLSINTNALQDTLLNFGVMPNLKELDISDNNFSKIPHSIGEVPSLEVLNISSNPITNFTLAESVKLKKLNLNFCKLITLEIAPNSFPKLENLSLSQNKLAHILSLPSNLISLDISENPLTTLPSDINRLHRLYNLDARETLLTALPDRFGELRYLEYLTLDDMPKLAAVPASFSNLINLKHLSLNNCKSLFRAGFPVEFTSLTSLETLYAMSCNITMLPNAVSKLQNLKNLDLSDNANLLTLSSGFAQLKNLEDLDLSDCPKIFSQSFPNEIFYLNRLEYLRLSNCSISTIPNEISNLTKLQFIGLDGSPALAPQAKAIKKLLPKNCDISID